MKIIQILPILLYGDAVGNEVIAIYGLLKSKGYQTAIYMDSKKIDKRLPSNIIVDNIDRYHDDKDNIIIYHLATESRLNRMLLEFKAHVIIRFHNITPPYFFEPYNSQLSEMLVRGIEEVKGLSKKAEMCFAVSEFNKKDLIRYGYECPIVVLPILLNMSLYKEDPSKEIIEKYQDNYLNIVFTGRIVPNKKIEDVIQGFYLYNSEINSRSRLFLVGSYDKNDQYYCKLERYVRLLKARNIVFTNHAGLKELVAYYHLADIYLCMSEHEGFCVPLVEAMYFNIPIIAFKSSAIGDTARNAAILLDDKSPEIVAEAIDLIIKNSELRERLLQNEAMMLENYRNGKVAKEFLAALDGIIEEIKK